MKNIGLYICQGYHYFTQSLNWLASIAMLINRLYLAKVFIWSGWLKITSWTTTVFMFGTDYRTGFLSPLAAAYLGTITEIVFPFFLLIGLGSRAAALGLFIFNLISVWSYPILLTSEYFCALKDHILWAVLIAIPIFYGPGFLSVDYLLKKKICKEYQY